MGVTRDDVARRAGVSPAVVSYVSNDGPRPVAAGTRERVLAAMAELGYRPDGLARSLRLGRTFALGLILPDATNPFFAELARAVEEAAFERGYVVLVCNTADDADREDSYIRRLVERRIDGLILVSAHSTQDLTDLSALSIPVVVLDRAADSVDASTIRADSEQAVRLGMEHLIAHGHSRIGFVGGPDLQVADARRQGWRRACIEHGVREVLEVSAPFSFQGGADAVRDLAPLRPTAVLVSADVQAIGMLGAMQSSADRIAIVAIDGTAAGAFAAPGLTSVAQPIEEMGRLAVEQLTRRDRAAPVHVVLGVELIVRASCGCDSLAAGGITPARASSPA